MSRTGKNKIGKYERAKDGTSKHWHLAMFKKNCQCCNVNKCDAGKCDVRKYDIRKCDIGKCDVRFVITEL